MNREEIIGNHVTTMSFSLPWGQKQTVNMETKIQFYLEAIKTKPATEKIDSG